MVDAAPAAKDVDKKDDAPKVWIKRLYRQKSIEISKYYELVFLNSRKIFSKS